MPVAIQFDILFQGIRNIGEWRLLNEVKNSLKIGVRGEIYIKVSLKETLKIKDRKLNKKRNQRKTTFRNRVELKL